MSSCMFYRVVGRSASVVIVVVLLENRKINVIFDKKVNGMFKSAGLQLIFKVDRQHYALTIVIVLKTGHVESQQNNHADIIPKG